MESHHPSGLKHNGFASGRVSTSACALFPDGEFPKAGEQDIFPRFEAGLDELQDGFNELGGFHLGKAALTVDAFRDVLFGQGHVVSYLFLFTLVRLLLTISVSKTSLSWDLLALPRPPRFRLPSRHSGLFHVYGQGISASPCIPP